MTCAPPATMGRHGGGVIARRVHDDQALLALDLFGVIIYSIDGAVATLVDAAQRLLLQRGDAAGLVARRGVALADIFADSVEVRLKAAGDLIDAIRGLPC